MMQRLQRDADAVLDEVIDLVFHMKHVGYEEMMRRTPGERQRMREYVQRQYNEQTKAVKAAGRK